MARQLELRVLLSVDFENERKRIQNAFGKKQSKFANLLLEFIDAIEKEDPELVKEKWAIVEKSNPDSDTRAVEYIDPSIVTYWHYIAKEKKVLLEGPEAMNVFDELRRDSAIVKLSTVQITAASLAVDQKIEP